jgi:zona occludens toxin (predicted ATPase)
MARQRAGRVGNPGPPSVTARHRKPVVAVIGAGAGGIAMGLRTMTRRGIGTLDVRRPVMDRYNRKIQSAMVNTVWTAGCTNYFRTPSGKVVTQLPYSGGRYWARTRLFGAWQYHTRPAPVRRRAPSTTVAP